jgi:large repetitive protein
VRRFSRVPLVLATIVSTALAVVGMGAGPALAKYSPPSIHLGCAAVDGGGPRGSVCALPPGVTTAPDDYSATIPVSKVGAVGATVTFALTAGSLPPGLTMPTQSSGSGVLVTGNPTQAGTFNFTVTATDGGLTSTLAYQITVTVQGLPDQLLCAAATGSYLLNGTCVLPDVTLGLPYQGHLTTSHSAGGSLSIVSGALPAGLTLPATFGAAGDIVGGTVTQPLGESNTYTFIAAGTGDQGQPLYQGYQVTVDPDQPLAITLAAGGSTLPPAMVGGAYDQDFFFSGGAAPYTWSVKSGSLPPGLALTNPYGPGDNDSGLSGTPTTAGTYTFTMQIADYDGAQATQQFSLTVAPTLQISTTMPTATVGVPYSHDLVAQGGTPPYSWSVVNNISELPPGLTLDTTNPGYNNVLAGTPTQAGTFSFPMQVQDSQDDIATGTVTITINP